MLDPLVLENTVRHCCFADVDDLEDCLAKLRGSCRQLVVKKQIAKRTHFDEISILNRLHDRVRVVLRRLGGDVRVAVLESKVKHRLRSIVVLLHREQRTLHLAGIERHAFELGLRGCEAARKLESQAEEHRAEERRRTTEGPCTLVLAAMLPDGGGDRPGRKGLWGRPWTSCRLRRAWRRLESRAWLLSCPWSACFSFISPCFTVQRLTKTDTP